MKIGDKVRFRKPVAPTIKTDMIGLIKDIRGDVLVVEFRRDQIPEDERNTDWPMFLFEDPEVVAASG